MGAVSIDCSSLWKAAEGLLENVPGGVEGLSGKTVAVTGSTGLIGSQLVRALLFANEKLDLGMQLVLPVRNAARAERLFGVRDDAETLRWSLGDPLELPSPCDVFVHAACSTSSRDFSERPVETALGVFEGTSSCLRAAHVANCSAFVYLSSMEVYGEPAAKPAKETDLGAIDPTDPRNSYPLAKLASENLALSFAAEYGMRTVVLRLAQTFGGGVRRDDERVFAEFARCAEEGRDIVLLSDGSKRNCYLSVNDAASAILAVLANDEASGAYNVANPDTYCSILEMARRVLREFGPPDAGVSFGFDGNRAKAFRKGSDIQFDISRMRGLGWEPSEGLRDAYGQLLNVWSDR